MGAGAERAVAPPSSLLSSPPHTPHPGFVPAMIIALLVFSVRYNSGMFYNLHLFIDTRFYTKIVYKIIMYPPEYIPQQLECLRCSS